MLSLSLPKPPPPPGPVPSDVPWPPPHFEWWNAVEVTNSNQEKEDDDEKEGGNKGGKKKVFEYQGLVRTLDFVASTLESRGPFDGFLAFSQGTILASLLLAAWSKSDEAREKKEAAEEEGRRVSSSSNASTSSSSSTSSASPLVLPPRLADLRPSARPRFAVLVSGVWAKAPICSALEGEEEGEGEEESGGEGARWTRRESGSGDGNSEDGANQNRPSSSSGGGCIRAPSIHIIGKRDYVAPLSRKLARAFSNSVVVEHAGGHVVPRLPPDDLATLRAFLGSQLQAGNSSL